MIEYDEIRRDNMMRVGLTLSEVQQLLGCYGSGRKFPRRPHHQVPNEGERLGLAVLAFPMMALTPPSKPEETSASEFKLHVSDFEKPATKEVTFFSPRD